MSDVIIFGIAVAVLIVLPFAAWRRYLWAAEKAPDERLETCSYTLSDVFGDGPLINAPHQDGVQWLTDVFCRSAAKFPHLTALQIPHTGESLTFAELDARAENIASAVFPFLTGPDQVVAVAMSQDNWQIVAAHLGILKAGGTVMFLDTTMPDALIAHMLNDAQPVVILTRGQDQFSDLPTLDVLTLPEKLPRRERSPWLDDPRQRLATIFYTSGTTGMPKGVECPHAGFVNLARSYADYFDLLPGMDATSLTSSLGYDGSISEMYSAWVSGCAVVMLTKEQIRSGPDLIPILCEAEVTVLFCPPVLLTTLTQTPEVDLPYPLCRYIVPAGEAFPSALVEPWTRGRRQIINTYGPTEASTDTSRQSLRPGELITIGSPFPNVTYVILEIDQLVPLPHGNVGELCIGGVHVARGYRNLPEQTALKFIVHPRFGRLYRTGDRCRIDIQTQRVHFLGRIDAQLKVRGHRVEVQAVEDILQTQFPEIEAAVLDYQNEALVAFVAAPSVCDGEFSEVTPAPAEWAARVTATLARQLPEPSIPTRIFLVETFVMKPVSGKIDRRCLPNLSQFLGRNGESDADDTFGDTRTIARDPETSQGSPPDPDEGMNPQCEEVLAICRAVFETPLGPDDGFAEAGGHSIVIARLAQRLQSAGWIVPVRALLSDCNSARKVAARPRLLQQVIETVADPVETGTRVVRDERAAEVLSIRYFTGLQVLFGIFLYSPGIAAFVIFFDVIDVETYFTAGSLREFIIGSFLLNIMALISPFACLLWVMMVKSFMSGDWCRNNVTPGIYAKWSRMHLRLWCIGRLENLVLLPLRVMYRSAPVMAFVLKQLGAKIGHNVQCAFDATLSGPLDFVTIGDSVTIQTGAYIQSTRWSGEYVHIGPVCLDRGCKIGMRAAIGNNVTVGDGTWITPFTAIFSNVGAKEIWEGAPARLIGRCTELKRTAENCHYALPIWLLETINLLMQVCLFFCLNLLPTAAIAWFARGMIPTGLASLSDAYVSATPLLLMVWNLTLFTFTTAWVTIVVTSVLNCLFIRCTAASSGLYPAHSLRGSLLMYRMFKMNNIQRLWNWTITGQYLRALAGVRFRRVGASECDLMYNLVPELATADSQVFWSNGCYTNMLDCGAEHFTLRQLAMPQNFFSGNNCVAEYGQFPSNFLLGVSTPGNELQFRRQMRSRPGEPITVAGNPPVKFASASFEVENETHKPPGFPLFLARVLLNDFFSIGVLHVAEGLLLTILYICFGKLGGHQIVSAVCALILTEITLVLICVAIKKILVGSEWGVDHTTPFWSLRHFAYFFAQDCFFVWCRGPLGFFAGTILANPLLQWMGCRIGHRTIVTQPLQCFDWNAVSFGKNCVIDGFLQLHTLESMMLKVKRTHIEDGCAVNAGATVMGGAVIQRDTTLLPLSLILKEMTLLTGTYEGSPAQAASTSGVSSGVHLAMRPACVPQAVDNTDWLKAAAILFVFVDHFGYFFMENDLWWSVFGRLAAPTFFFLAGYAKTRTVPLHWVGLGIFLTLLDSWNADWTWVTPNILLSLAFIRFTRSHVQFFAQRRPGATYAVLLCALLPMLPAVATIIDYGVEGWLWALFGLYQRQYRDGRSFAETGVGFQGSASPAFGMTESRGLLRLLTCFVAAIVYVWQEQLEFSFPPIALAVVIPGIGVLALVLCLFLRGASRIQPPETIAGVLRFVGRHTLELYALQLICCELIVGIMNDLSP